MNELDVFRLEQAESAIERGRGLIGSDPDAAYFQLWSGYLLRISTGISCSGLLPVADVRSLVDATVELVANCGATLHLTKQNEILILAVAAGYRDGAVQVASIVCDSRRSHGFDIRLNALLRSALGASVVDPPRDYAGTRNEDLLFNDIAAVSRGLQSDLSGTDRYWRATKSKRYALTVFSYENLFRTALEQLQSMGPFHCTSE